VWVGVGVGGRFRYQLLHTCVAVYAYTKHITIVCIRARLLYSTRVGIIIIIIIYLYNTSYESSSNNNTTTRTRVRVLVVVVLSYIYSMHTVSIPT
jgi:hypothetical protein